MKKEANSAHASLIVFFLANDARKRNCFDELSIGTADAGGLFARVGNWDYPDPA